MKKFILTSIFLAVALIGNCSTDSTIICTSKSSKTYHRTKLCAGLNLCKSEIKVLRITDTMNVVNNSAFKPRTACKKCFKQSKAK